MTSAYFVSHSEIDRSTTSVLLKEGQSAEISCMTRGTGDFFWRKGETLYNSILVASFTVGDVSDDSQPYSVTVNGTLHVKSVTLKDEGNYFCRVSSTESECYGEVKILVQASLRNFDLAIDRCDRESSCLLYLDPSQFTSLTCTALNASPLMTLKWFNGSKEIIEGIQQNEILTQNGTSRDITSTVVAVYGHPASLTCQAVDPKRSNDDVRFAHAQVEMKVPVHETLPSWIIVAVTLAGCFIVFVIFLLIKARANRKKAREIKERKEEFSLLSVEKDREITELKGKLSQTEEELKKKREDAHQFEVNVHVKDTELRNICNELRELKEDLTKKERELNHAKGQKQCSTLLNNVCPMKTYP
ncbi:hypothetical protein BSL78_23821 [Apostichopus japonicus]|uniref:Ig-like domain-containing protein n=1 Tax=Stichopus japonicus TaxID=307972 RepID=A0A2G8JUD8_STIJA|nr:hypothetical protein BSL78_23821 [Apostichopus japonicus]